MFPPKPDGRKTDRQTEGRTYGGTDISIYKVASLLKRAKWESTAATFLSLSKIS